MTKPHPSIFREYDIRGIFGQTLYEQDAYKIGLGFSKFVREAGGDKVVIGFDGRLSSPALVDALAAGLIVFQKWMARKPALSLSLIHI